MVTDEQKKLINEKDTVIKNCYEFAQKFLVLPNAAYKGEYAYYMDLTADNINALAEKGGYVFRLASAADHTIQGIDQE